MSFHLKRNLIIWAILLYMVHIAKCQDDLPPDSEEEEDDSSSEETVEDSNESGNRRRRRRSLDSMEEAKSKEVDSTNGLSIPGLPDPAAILKLVEVLKSVGQEVLPIFVQGNSAGDFVVQRLDKDVKFVKDMKNEIDTIRKKLKI